MWRAFSDEWVTILSLRPALVGLRLECRTGDPLQSFASGGFAASHQQAVALLLGGELIFDEPHLIQENID